jgi:hypothetical protein
MTTSQTLSFLTEILESDRIPIGKLEYFRARLQSRLHQLVLDEFLRQEDQGLHQAQLARRIGRKPEVINRLLGAPGNWTLNTVSDLLLGMGLEPELATERLRNMVAQGADANLIEEMNPSQSTTTIPAPQPASARNMRPDISTDLNRTLKSWMQELPFGGASVTSVQSAPGSGAMPDSIKALQKQTVIRKSADSPNYNPTAWDKSQRRLS